MRISAKLIIRLLIVAGVFGVGVYLSSPDNLAQFTDQVRNLVGPAPVAFAENVFYDTLDRYNQWAYRDRTTPGYWSVPGVQAVTTAPAATSNNLSQLLSHLVGVAEADLATPRAKLEAALPALPTPGPLVLTSQPSLDTFHPTDFAPLYPKIAAPGEGQWVPLAYSSNANAPGVMYKVFVHPDPQRSYARVAIVAIDLRRVQLHAVAGTQEPVSTVKLPRPGLVDAADQAALLGAFNGGFRSIHGHWGMMVEGQTLLPPQNVGGTIAHYRDGGLSIAPWSFVADTAAQMDWYRQTPPYLVFQGKVNPSLSDETSTLWGATVDRQTVIWRSALGISTDHHTLYYGAGESLTALRLAQAMLTAGASAAAELDVNLSYERFLTYDPYTKNPNGTLLLPNMQTKPQLYTVLPAPRDFFYFTLSSQTH